ncbi:SH3 domain-containing protein [Aggregatilinea lenta]|uniref:SH3 domain-containing protein n=1 Tax=Aggregatilinea lenta TaxID=913108 RepID=UPI0013C3106F|nr:SH3 domain-containing protein [Aggregatilinea lenta]
MRRLQKLGLPLSLLAGALAGSLLPSARHDSPASSAGECVPERYVFEAVCSTPEDDPAGVLLFVPRLSTATALPPAAPSATLGATDTPPALPTATGSPTVSSTPAATETATGTATADPELVCYGTVIATLPLNLRDGHATSAAVLAQAGPGTTWRIYAVWPTDPDAPTDEWVRVRLDDGRDAWMASHYGGEDYVRFETTDACAAVRWPNGTDEATSTPVPTATATPVATEPSGPVGTPTPESGVAPVPTSEDGKACTVTLLEGSMIRAGAGTGYVATGSATAGEPLEISRVVADSAYAWGQHDRGWTALYTLSESAWRVGVWGSEGETCLDVPGWTEVGLDVPPYATAWGVLTTVGADKATVQEMVDIVKGAGRMPALTVVMDASMAVAFDDQAYVIWRPWPDCPEMLDDVAASVQARLDYVDLVTRHSGFDALQLTNECLWPSPSYLNAWTLEALRQAWTRWPGKQIIPWVWAPGTFQIEWLPTLRPALMDMAAHGDLFGLNLYPARVGVPLSTRDAWTIWTTWRYEMIQAQFEPGADPCFVVTEAGAGDGNMPLTP